MRVLLGFLLLVRAFDSWAVAQDSKPVEIFESDVKVIESNRLGFQNRTNNFTRESKTVCLESGFGIKNILDPKIIASNANSSVKVKKGLSDNCVEVIVELPPARQECRNFFAPSLLNGSWERKVCSAPYPTNLELYVAVEADRTGISSVLPMLNDAMRNLGDVEIMAPRAKAPEQN